MLNGPLTGIDPLGLANSSAINPNYNPRTAKKVPWQVSIGAGGSGAFGPTHYTADSGFAADNNGTLCFYTNKCLGGGWNHPLNGTLGIAGQVAPGALCTGTQTSQGVYWYGGSGIGGEGQVHKGADGLQISRGLVGVTFSPDGGAAGAGWNTCQTQYYCLGGKKK